MIYLRLHIERVAVDITSHLFNGGFDFIKNELHHFMNILTDVISNLPENFSLTIDNNFLKEAMECLASKVATIVEFVASLSKSVPVEILQKGLISAMKAMEMVRTKVARVMLSICERLQEYHIVKQVLDMFVAYQNWFEELHLASRVESMLGEMTGYVKLSQKVTVEIFKFPHSSVVESTAVAMMKVYGKMADIMETLSHYLDSYMEKHPSTPIDKVLHEFFGLISAIFNQFSLERSLPRLVDNWLEYIETLSSLCVRAYNVMYNGDSWLTYSLAQGLGKLEYEQTLPFEWTSFKELPSIFKLFQKTESQPMMTSGPSFDFIDFQHSLLDNIDTFNKALATKNLIPPFTAHALISGDSNIRTLDGKFYSFFANCNYLLTSDFLHNRFSVIGHFKNGKRTSITVINGPTKINIDNELKVVMNGRQLGLPQTVGDIFVMREGEKIFVDTNDGLRVMCNAVTDVCSFTVSGWYFSKTGGLLGVYDNEPANDWMTPERKVVNDLETFVNSWLVGEDDDNLCKVEEPHATTSLSMMEQDQCSNLFEREDSALMPCFTTVDTDTFKKMCEADMKAIKNEPNKVKGICPSAAAYIEYCHLKGVELWMPSSCVTCEDPSAGYSLGHGESKTYRRDSPRSTDVVFIVEQKKCLEDANLKTLPKMINMALVGKDMRENKFAVVGFGGKEEMEGPKVFLGPMVDTFMSHDKVPRALQL